MLTCDQRSEQEVGLKLTIIGGRGVLQKLPELAFLPPMCLSQQDLQYPFLKTSSIPPLSKTPSTDECGSAVGWRARARLCEVILLRIPAEMLMIKT